MSAWAKWEAGDPEQVAAQRERTERRKEQRCTCRGCIQREVVWGHTTCKIGMYKPDSLKGCSHYDTGEVAQ